MKSQRSIVVSVSQFSFSRSFFGLPGFCGVEPDFFGIPKRGPVHALFVASACSSLKCSCFIFFWELWHTPPPWLKKGLLQGKGGARGPGGAQMSSRRARTPSIECSICFYPRCRCPPCLRARRWSLRRHRRRPLSRNDCLGQWPCLHPEG